MKKELKRKTLMNKYNVQQKKQKTKKKKQKQKQKQTNKQTRETYIICHITPGANA